MFPTPHSLTKWGILFIQKGEQGLAPLEGFKPYSFWHHTLSSFFFVDLEVELASNWYGVEAMRNLGPVEDLIYGIANPDIIIILIFSVHIYIHNIYLSYFYDVLYLRDFFHSLLGYKII